MKINTNCCEIHLIKILSLYIIFFERIGEKEKTQKKPLISMRFI